MNLSRYSNRHEKTYHRQPKKGLKAGKFNAAFVSVEIPEVHDAYAIQQQFQIQTLQLGSLAVETAATQTKST